MYVKELRIFNSQEHYFFFKKKKKVKNSLQFVTKQFTYNLQFLNMHILSEVISVICGTLTAVEKSHR